MHDYREFFVMPYLVMFHDTMAYGSHHFMTNFKFQCVIREHLLFDNLLDVTSEEQRREFEDCVLLTKNGYCNNLAPAKVGEKVAILLTVEDQSISTVRLCFRVIRYDGVPVTCGFQTLLPVAKETGVIVRAPAYLAGFSSRLAERLRRPSFADRALAGKTRDVFDPEAIEIGVAVANAQGADALPRFIRVPDGDNVVQAGTVMSVPDTVHAAQGSTDGDHAERLVVAKTGLLRIHRAAQRDVVQEFQCTVTADNVFLNDHLVEGRPTYPGAFLVELVSEVAREMCPGQVVTRLRDLHLMRFIKLPSDGRSVMIRAEAEIMQGSEDGALIAVRILTDFVHRSGTVLQKDVVHMDVRVQMSRSFPQIKAAMRSAPDEAVSTDDPYLSPDSPVRLSGPFNCLSEIRIGQDRRTAVYKVAGTETLAELRDYRAPVFLLDAMLRFSMLHIAPDGSVPVYVPIRCGSLELFGINDLDLVSGGLAVSLEGSTPVVSGDTIRNDQVIAIDGDGRVIAIASNLEAQRAGEVYAVKRVVAG